MGLILHCGAKEVDYQQLKDYTVTPRNHSWVNNKTGKEYSINRSERWAGIQHYDFASSIVETCKALNMEVNMETSKWGVSDEGSDLFALLKFKSYNQVLNKETVPYKYAYGGVIPSLGLRHSNRGRFSAQGTVGGSVIVCDNLMITGQFVFKHKHTTGNVNNLTASIASGMLEYCNGLPRLKATVEHLQEGHLSEEDVGEFYTQLGRRKIVPWSHLGKIDKYWLKPTHSQFLGSSPWSMYNAVNTVVKEYNPLRQFEVVSKATELLVDHTRINPELEEVYV